MNNLKRKNLTARALCVLLSIFIISFSFVPALAAVEYPSGVTSETALSTIGKLDDTIKGIMKSNNTSLKQIVLEKLYSDESLSALLTGIYGTLEAEAGDSLGAVGINTSVSGVAGKLGRYPEVAKKLSSFSSWSQVSLEGVKWDVKNKSEFGVAVSTMLSPFNELLYALLCSGSYTPVLLIGIKGSDGYETAILPTLEAFGCKEYISPEDFYAQAKKDKGTMIYNIVYDLVTYVEKVLSAPMDMLTANLPSIAQYFLNGGFDNAVSTLMSPLRLQVLNIATLVPVESFSSFLTDTESFTQNFTLNINDMLSQTGIAMAPVDLQLVASLGTVNEDGTVTSERPQVLIVLLRWLIESLKLNQSSLNELLPQGDEAFIKTASDILSKPADELISLIVSLLNQKGALINDSQWAFPEFSAPQVQYTPNLTAEKYQRVADGLDELLDQLIAETGEAKSMGALIKRELYSSKALTALMKGLFGELEKEELTAVTDMLGIDISPKGVAQLLGSKGFIVASQSLSAYSKWSDIGQEGVDLGIKTGNKGQFLSMVASLMSPFEDILGMLLAEDKLVLFDSVELYGSNGYNTAIIPLYEALGCDASTIKTHEQFKALYNSGKGIEALLDPIASLLERFESKPAYTLLQILPNLIYFIESGGLDLCINNLIFPITSLLSPLGISAPDFSLREELDLNGLLSELTASTETEIALPEIKIEELAKFGTATEKTSKRTVNGQPASATYIESDMPAICVSLLRILAEAIKNPQNNSLLLSLTDMGAQGTMALPEGSEDIVNSFMTSVINDINAMSIDEATEWLYKLFFRERATVTDFGNEDYLPTVIYKPEKDYSFVLVIIFALMLIPVGVIVRNKIILKRMKENQTESLQEV